MLFRMSRELLGLNWRVLLYDSAVGAGLLKSLEDGGWIVRAKDTVNDRILIAQLTPSGEKLLETGEKLARVIDDKLWQGIPDRAVETINRLLEQCLANLEENRYYPCGKSEPDIVGCPVAVIVAEDWFKQGDGFVSAVARSSSSRRSRTPLRNVVSHASMPLGKRCGAGDKFDRVDCEAGCSSSRR